MSLKKYRYINTNKELTIQMKMEVMKQAGQRLLAHFITISSIFIILKIYYLNKLASPLELLPWLIASDLFIALLFSTIATISNRLSYVVTDIIIIFYAINIHYGLLFGSFIDTSVSTYLSEPLQMYDSIIEIFQWDISIFVLIALISHRFITKKTLTKLAVLNFNQQSLILCISVIFISILRIQPDLSLYLELKNNPIKKIAYNLIQPKNQEDIKKSPLASLDSLSIYPRQATKPAIIQRKVRKRMNVIMISLESTGSISMSLKNKKIMPQFHELAKNGVYWDNFYASIPMSIKSIFSSHSGYYPAADMTPISVKNPKIDIKAIPQHFKENGYRTALLHGGKFSYTQKNAFLEERGYDEMYDAASLPKQKKYEQLSWGIDDQAVFDYAKNWIDQDSDTPFFLKLIPVLVHHPYKLPKHWTPKIKGESSLNKYHNALNYEDNLLESLVTHLKKQNKFKNTIFVLFGDHGEAFGQHRGNFIHSGQIYEENIKIPLLISNPRMFKKPQQNSTLGILPDIVPTLLDVAGIAFKKDNLHGRSLFTATPNRMVFFYSGLGSEKIGLRDDQYKYIYRPNGNTSELYDLVSDPDEKINIAKSHKERVLFYQTKVIKWKDHSIATVRLSQSSAKARSTKDNKIIRLTDLPIAFSSQQWGSLSYNKSVNGNTFHVAGVKFPEYGLGTHSNSIITFDVSKYRGHQFEVKVGRDDEDKSNRKQKIKPEIRIDGKLVFSGFPMSSHDSVIDISIPITGDRLSLIVHKTNDGGAGDHTNWIAPHILL